MEKHILCIIFSHFFGSCFTWKDLNQQVEIIRTTLKSIYHNTDSILMFLYMNNGSYDLNIVI